MAFSDLTATLNRGGYFFSVAVCSLFWMLLIAVLLLLMRRRATRLPPLTVEDETHLERQSKNRNPLKKTKQKRTQVKAATSASLENAGYSNPDKASSEQLPEKSILKEKQDDEKTKLVQRKGSTTASVSSQKVQKMTETSGDWTLAGSKKKQKSKKLDPDVENLKGKATSSMQTVENDKTVDPTEISLPREVVAADKITKSAVAQEQFSMASKKKSIDGDNVDVLLNGPIEVDVLHKQLVNNSHHQAGFLNPMQVEQDEDNFEVVQSASKESKSQKTSKKKKSKLSAEVTRNGPEDGEKADNKSLIKTLESRTKNAKYPNGVSSAPETSEDLSKFKVPVNGEDQAVGIPKDMSETQGPDSLKAVSEAPSENMDPKFENGLSERKISKTVNSSFPDTYEDTVLVNGPAENVVADAWNDVVCSSDGSTLPVQIVFDELGLKDEALNSSQAVLKKRKKVRKDI